VTERLLRLRNAGPAVVRLITAAGGAGSAGFFNRKVAFKLAV
jgi:hypothetical protein